MRDARSRRVVCVLGFVEIVNWGSSYYLLAALSAAIIAETGWSLTLVVAANSFALVMAALISPMVGRNIARKGGRSVLMTGSLCFAMGLILLAVALHPLVYYAAWALIGLGMGAGLYDAIFATLGQMYGQSARRPISIVTLWAGFASTLSWPLTAWIISFSGWREAVLFYAALHLFVCLPLLAWTLPKTTAPSPKKTADIPSPRPIETREKVQLILLVVVLMILGLLIAAISVHLIILLGSVGLSVAEAVAIGALIGPAQVLVRIVEIIGGGRQHPIWNMLFSCISFALGLGLWASGMQVAALAAIIYGLGTGSYSIARGTLPLALFGADRYAFLMGRIARPLLLSQALGPILGGWLIAGMGGSQTLAIFTIFALINCAIAAALFMTVRYKPAQF